MGQSYRLKCRGCQKRMLMLKSTGGELFDEAYFILKEVKNDSYPSENEMISEANRIISENMIIAPAKNAGEDAAPKYIGLRWFLCGALSAVGAYSVLYALLYAVMSI